MATSENTPQGHPLPRLRRRAPDTHKGTYGRVLVLAGSPGMAGAAILTLRAALRSGAGLATGAIPHALSTPVTIGVPEATQLLLTYRSGDKDGELAANQLVASWSEQAFAAAAIGPGLGQTARTRGVVAAVLGGAPCPCVVDADALNAVADQPEIAAPRREDRVWTPHPGEFKRLTGESPQGDEERAAAARRFVARFGGVVILKGHRTVIADQERVAINETGNPGMATGGAGDVLTGVVAALLAQGLPPFDAARLGAHVHGLAGDLACEELGETSLVAGDLIEHLPAAFLSLAES